MGETEIEMQEKLQEKLQDLRANVERLEEKTRQQREFAGEDSGPGRKTLIRLSLEIEKELAQLCKKAGLTDTRFTWRKSVDGLVQAGAIDPALAKAILDFRDVRNQVIHSGLRRPVKQDILARAIDDGLIILQYLRSGETGGERVPN